MKIRKLQLKNIGVFDDETIEFQPCPVEDKAEIHIFTGQNGSGKSTILMAITSSFKFVPNPHNNELSHEKRELISAVSDIVVEDTYGSRGEMRRVERALNNFLEKLPGELDESKDKISEQNTGEFFKRLKDNKEASLRNSFAEVFTDSHFMARIYGCSQCQVIHTDTWGEIETYNRAISSLNLTRFRFDFAVFAFSGYRQIKAERLEAIKEPKNFNPLSQSLEFNKDYSENSEITINQLIANNISKRGVETVRNNLEKAEKFRKVISSIEQITFEITGWRIEFYLETEPTNLIIKVNGEELDFDVLPDGLRSLISWIADLLGRVDLLKWNDDLPIFEKNLILFLDEIEVHLHPSWQRKVLPVVQKLFKNSQIFVSTHSPFVVNSIDDAWVYKLELENGKARVAEVVESENSNSITQVLREVFGIEEWFGLEVQNNLERFKELKNKIISNDADESAEKELLEKAKILADEPNDQLKQIIRKDLEELGEKKNKPYTL